MFPAAFASHAYILHVMYLHVKWFAAAFSSQIRELGSAENDAGVPEGSEPHKETREHGADVNHPVAHGEISIARRLDLNCAENRSLDRAR